MKKLEDYKEEKTDVETYLKNMDEKSLAKWCCFVDAFSLIENASLKHNIDFLESKKMITKTTKNIQKYIKEKYHAKLHDIKVEKEQSN